MRRERDPALLESTALSKRFGGFVALSDVSLTVRRGERLGIIGPNGSGKTTLINCICGSLRSDGGSIGFDGTDVTRLPSYRRTRLGIARSFQIPRPFASMTLAENVAVPLEYVTHRRSLHTADVRGEALAILAQMGLGERADAAASSSYPGRSAQAGAGARAGGPAVAADTGRGDGRPVRRSRSTRCSASSSDLNQRGMTIIMIEHIMRAIMRFSERVVCLDAGQIMAEGTPAHIANDPNVQQDLSRCLSSRSRAGGRLRRGARAARCVARGAPGRDRRAAGDQRQRQEHADEMHHGVAEAVARVDRAGARRRAHRPDGQEPAGDRRARASRWCRKAGVCFRS